jgi:tRNA (cmo5U34)-methyltransferase
MSEQIIIDFDKNAPIAGNEYDKSARMALPGYEAMHAMALACLRYSLSLSHLSKTSEKAANLLIVGAGTGMELVNYAQGNPDWCMLGVDPSANMLAIASQKIQEYGLSEQVKVFQGYTHQLPDNPDYDAATAILVMHFIPDDGSKLEFLQSIYQRLKPSAPLVLVDSFGEKSSDELERKISIMKCFWQEAGVTQEKVSELLERFATGVYPIPEARVIELLQQAGFANIMMFYTGIWIGGWVANK